MMNQFECWDWCGKRYLMEVSTFKYDFMLGFRRVIKELN